MLRRGLPTGPDSSRVQAPRKRALAPSSVGNLWPRFRHWLRVRPGRFAGNEPRDSMPGGFGTSCMAAITAPPRRRQTPCHRTRRIGPFRCARPSPCVGYPGVSAPRHAVHASGDSFHCVSLPFNRGGAWSRVGLTIAKNHRSRGMDYGPPRGQGPRLRLKRPVVVGGAWPPPPLGD